MDPYAIIDVTKINDAYSLWNKHLPNIHVYYAVKCNPHPSILQRMNELGIQFDCASKQEIDAALHWTTPNHILYANPCKFSNHIAYAKEKEVTLTVVDCECEIRKMKEIYPKCHLLLRIAVNDASSKCQLSSKFGCKMYEVRKLLLLIKELHVPLVGFSFHVGSGCTQPSLYYDALCDCYEATQMAESLGIPIRIIDIGGGFTQSNFIECAEEVKRGMEQLKGKRFISEVGRFLVEKSHTLYLQVICKKITNKRIYYLNDGVYGTLNCKIFDHAKPILQCFKSGELFESTVYGPTCDSFDVIEESIWLPELFVGDQLFVEDCGAYTTASATSFNGYTVDSILSTTIL
jgi:ornithine decarboxylase